MVTEWLEGPGLPEDTQWVWPRVPGWSLERRKAGLYWSDLYPTKRYPYWGGTLLSFPVWILLVLSAPLLWWFWKSAQRPKDGFCQCGYDLTGLPEPRCPESGQPFNPTWCQTSGKDVTRGSQ